MDFKWFFTNFLEAPSCLGKQLVLQRRDGEAEFSSSIFLELGIDHNLAVHHGIYGFDTVRVSREGLNTLEKMMF